jgi:hypothetical protein
MTRSHALVVSIALAGLVPSSTGATDLLGGPNWTTVKYGSIDPQIAVGPDHVVITQNTMVYFHRKDGTLVSSTSVMDLFKFVWDPDKSENVNDGLNLPDGAKCYRNHPTEVWVSEKSDYSYCLTDWYDARTLYDSWRDRFVIVALARNGAAKCGDKDDGKNPRADLDARRTRLVVAYSGTPDPTVGSWVFTVFDAVPGESCTTKSCREGWGYEFGDAADYPVIGLHHNYLLMSVSHEGKPSPCVNGVSDGSYPDKTASLHVYQADRLATGKTDSKTCMGLCSWVYDWEDLKHDDGDGDPKNDPQVTGWLSPANTHGSSYLGDAWFAVPVVNSRDKLNVWHFDAQGSKTVPKLHRSTATLPKFDSVDRNAIKYEYPQPSTTATSNPAKLTLTFTRPLVMQDKYLYYADVGGMGSAPDASIRLAGLVLSGSGDNVKFELNRNAIFNVKNEGYGTPALEVDEKRTIVLAYSKFGKSSSDPSSFTGFGARYLTWTAGDATAPGGRPLATNEGSMPKSSPDSDARGKFDTAGIALAPNGRIYMIQPYVTSAPSWAYAVNYVNP